MLAIKKMGSRGKICSPRFLRSTPRPPCTLRIEKWSFQKRNMLTNVNFKVSRIWFRWCRSCWNSIPIFGCGFGVSDFWFWGFGFITLPMSAPLPTLAIWFRDVCEAMRSLFMSDENLRWPEKPMRSIHFQKGWWSHLCWFGDVGLTWFCKGRWLPDVPKRLAVAILSG